MSVLETDIAALHSMRITVIYAKSRTVPIRTISPFWAAFGASISNVTWLYRGGRVSVAALVSL